MKFNPLRLTGRLLRCAGNELLKRTLLNGVWIDVGAHHGEVTLSHALSNPALIVYAFEPNLRVASALFGRAQNYIVLPMAVTETDGCTQFHINSCDGASSLLAMDEDARRSWKGGDALQEEAIVTVPTIRLDSFMAITGIAHVDFLKIDTQGSDLSVIRSLGPRLRDIRKITLEVDVNPKRLYQGSPSKQQILSVLHEAGFRLSSTEQQYYGQEENLTFECTSPQ